MSSMNEYRKNLARYALYLSGNDQLTAAEIAEQMGVMAQQHGHPPECWKGISAQAVVPIMRGLTDNAAVFAGEPNHHTRKGRAEPTWRCIPALLKGIKFPAIPAIDYKPIEPAIKTKEAPKDEYEAMSRSQLLAVVRISDKGFGVMFRFFREMENFRDEAKEQLRSAGLDTDTN